MEEHRAESSWELPTDAQATKAQAQLSVHGVYGELVAALSHELMNQQGVVQINVQLLRRFGESDQSSVDARLSAIDRIASSAHNTTEIFSEMRDIGVDLFATPPLEGAEDYVQRPAALIPRLLELATGHRARALEFAADSDVYVPVPVVVGMTGMLARLLGKCCEGAAVRIQEGAAFVQCDRRSGDEDATEKQVEVEHMRITSSALGLWLRANGGSLHVRSGDTGSEVFARWSESSERCTTVP